MAKRRTKSGPAAEVKPLTQEELLAEAAKTELENARSLQVVTITKNPFTCRAQKEAPLWNLLVGLSCDLHMVIDSR